MDDVRHFSQTSLVGDEGTFFEIYLKGGGLIMIFRDTGRLRFYTPGTDVDGAATGILRGSTSALWNFAKGLAGEAQCAMCKYEGSWFTDIIDVQSEPPRIENTPRRLNPPG